MGGRGGYGKTDGILIAQLHGEATRQAVLKASAEDAVVELRAITERVDLLSRAAGSHMAAFRGAPNIWPASRLAADFLLAAGADLALAEAAASEVTERTAVPPAPGAGPNIGSAYG